MSTRIIVILETFTITVLAAISVIYAQVLWQRMHTTMVVTTTTEVIATSTTEVAKVTVPDLSVDEKTEILEFLKESPAHDSFSGDQKATFLKELSEDTTTAPLLSEKERSAILDNLAQ